MHKIKQIKQPIRASITIPADKSISHRALILSAIATGTTEINNFLYSNDTLATFSCLQELGVKIKYDKLRAVVTIAGEGKYFPSRDKVNLFAAESGTTMRILPGVLVGQPFASQINAAAALCRRPMRRIVDPLSLMGADIKARKENDEFYAPLSIFPVSELKGVSYAMKVSSAQVKSCIMLAALYAQGPTEIVEPSISRDHTERMLGFFNANIKKRANKINVQQSQLKSPKNIYIPGDISSAAFFIALAVLLPDSQITMEKVSMNPSRCGFIDCLKKMGADIQLRNKTDYFEPYADIVASSSQLKGISIDPQQVPLMIDEVPILLVCAAFAQGTTIINGVKELIVKETNRIESMVSNLRKAGIDIEAVARDDDWLIKVNAKGSDFVRRQDGNINFKSFADHRTAMSLIVFSMASGGDNYIDQLKCIDKSFPDFLKIVKLLKSDAIS